MTYDDLWYSIRRTLIPLVVGWLLAQAARYGFSIPPESLTGVLEPIFAGAYYVVVRWLEMKFPQLGILLGALKQPTYEEDIRITEARLEKQAKKLQ